MEFEVINGELHVGSIDITYLSTASVFLVGDIRTITLYGAFETPPEKVIVGVTVLPFVE
ncbi:spore gernimation protein GerPD [Paenibacillus sp. OAS669]|uniref:spore gernimation protein GerPD n=1 Tax=Paenibacillus sp. OAS669 TaxID=2663821 RepID=UPI0017897DD0|nr:spore gernimation protein GerPD [Paenibacillus sp. OAS669]MBE1445463.1 spore germination protein PD [Paenibacillus sp. OAS669]